MSALTPEFRDWLVRGEPGSAQRERYDNAVAAWNAGCTEAELARLLGIPSPPAPNHTFNPGSLTDEEAQALYWSLRAELRERGLSTTTHKWPLPKKEEQ